MWPRITAAAPRMVASRLDNAVMRSGTAATVTAGGTSSSKVVQQASRTWASGSCSACRSKRRDERIDPESDAGEGRCRMDADIAGFVVEGIRQGLRCREPRIHAQVAEGAERCDADRGVPIPERLGQGEDQSIITTEAAQGQGRRRTSPGYVGME